MFSNVKILKEKHKKVRAMKIKCSKCKTTQYYLYKLNNDPYSFSYCIECHKRIWI